MKKLYKLSAFYAILGIIGGVFFREFTKFNGFHEVTVLSTIHVHAFVLGMFMFLLLLLFEKNFMLSKAKNFSMFLWFYNSGLFVTIIMLWIRGVLEVVTITTMANTLSTGIDAAISGIAGIGHIILGVGLFYLFRCIKEQCLKD